MAFRERYGQVFKIRSTLEASEESGYRFMEISTYGHENKPPANRCYLNSPHHSFLLYRCTAFINSWRLSNISILERLAHKHAVIKDGKTSLLVPSRA